MNKKQKDSMTKAMNKVIGSIQHNRIEWIALSIKYTDGSTVALHTAEAPKRPKGLS